MARRGTPRLWLAMVLVAAGIGLAGGMLGGAPAGEGTRQAGAQPAAVTITPTTPDAAVVPARTEGRAGVADSARQQPARWLLPLVAALVGLTGARGAFHGRSGRSRQATGARPPLQARRHAIALRAPPSLQLA